MTAGLPDSSQRGELAGVATGNAGAAPAGAPAPAALSAPLRMSATALSAAIRARDLSCVEVMRAYLEHIDRANPSVNALVSLQDPAVLVQLARARDAQLDAGEYLGCLHGLPHAVKDTVPTAGLRTTWGSPLCDSVPSRDATLAARLRSHGAIFIGKTNVSEFGLGSHSYNTLFGTTLNAYDPRRAAGGSSGGAAAGLALRMLPLADGSDMMGSLRNPAAWNNVFGFRPSYGSVPAAGEELFVQQLTSSGAMARSVEDVAMLMSVIAGADAEAPLSNCEDPQRFRQPLGRSFQGTRLGWLGDLGGYLPFEPGVLEVCRAALDDFTSLGCVIEELRLPMPPQALWEAWVTLRHWLVAGELAALYRNPAQRERMKPEAQWEVARGLALSALDIYRASKTRTQWYRLAATLFARVDFLLLPSAQLFPFDAAEHWPRVVNGIAMDTYHRWMEVVVPASLLGAPVLSVPAGFGSAGLPMGLQIIGPPRADFAVLQLGHAYEQASGWVARRLPPLLR